MPDADHRSLIGHARAAELDPRARQQLVERERLGDVIDGTQLEALQLDRKIAARRQDQHREIRLLAVELPQGVEATETRQHQVEDHQVVLARKRAREPELAVADHINAESFGLERAGEKRANPRLILHDQYAHLLFRAPTFAPETIPLKR